MDYRSRITPHSLNLGSSLVILSRWPLLTLTFFFLVQAACMRHHWWRTDAKLAIVGPGIYLTIGNNDFQLSRGAQQRCLFCSRCACRYSSCCTVSLNYFGIPKCKDDLFDFNYGPFHNLCYETKGNSTDLMHRRACG